MLIAIDNNCEDLSYCNSVLGSIRLYFQCRIFIELIGCVSIQYIWMYGYQACRISIYLNKNSKKSILSYTGTQFKVI